MPQHYCSECGHGTPYTLKKPDKCEKCFTSFAVVEPTNKRRLDVEIEDDEPAAKRNTGRYNLAFEVDEKAAPLMSQDIVGVGGSDFAGVKTVKQINMRNRAKKVSNRALMQQLRDECKSSRPTPIVPAE